MRYGTTSTASVGEIMRRARDAFGAGGAGLSLVHLGIYDARFDGVAGFVRLTIQPVRDGNEIVVETREHDAEVVAFVRSLPHPNRLRQILRRMRGNRRPSVRP
jgi:hypothetical protein